jgi:hypothetical protein
MIRNPLDAVPLLIVHAASLLVPGAERAEWTAEWSSELWHAYHGVDEFLEGDSAGIADSRTAIAFSLGAMHDAFWLRWDTMRAHAATALRTGSVTRCSLVLSILAAAAVLVFLLLPGARNTMTPLPYHNASDLVILSSNGDPGTQTPSIRLADYREWTTDTAGLYSQIAFYQPVTGHVHLTHQRTAILTLAVASGNLLAMLGIDPAPTPSSSTPGPARLLLSRSAWRESYRSDPRILGRTAVVAGQTVVIAGLIPDSAWRLPGSVDGWILEDPHRLGNLPPTVKGFVVARIRSAAFPAPHAGWRSMVETRYGVMRKFECSSLDTLLFQPLFFFSCSLVLALVALPAITALSLGDYPFSREPLHRRLIAQRWLFLVAKLLLVVVIVFFWSTALAFGTGTLNLSSASAVQALTSFLPLLFGFRWVLQDQRRRCPVCLRLLSNPARVGQPSCNFLGWSGTELICASGHGLLHIPELPTSWFSTQRWLCLDPSWLCLFPDRSSPPAAELV